MVKDVNSEGSTMSNPPAAPTPEPDGTEAPPAPAQADAPAAPEAAPSEQPQAPQYAPPQYAPPQTPPQYAPPAPPAPPTQQPQYAPPQYPQQPYGQQPYAQPQYAPPQYPQQQYAPPQPQYAAVLPPAGPGEPFDGAQHPGELNRPLYGASMGQAFSRFFRNYANFSGRASRSEYWWMALSQFIAYFILIFIGFAASNATYQANPYGSADMDFASGFTALIFTILAFGLAIPNLALSWRRLHDSNQPGPLWFLALIPYVGWLIMFVFVLLAPKPEGRRFDRAAR